MLKVLGGDYRFETRFYLDDRRMLYVRGGGDPFLISEELAPLATDLAAVVDKMPIRRWPFIGRRRARRITVESNCVRSGMLPRCAQVGVFDNTE